MNTDSLVILFLDGSEIELAGASIVYGTAGQIARVEVDKGGEIDMIPGHAIKRLRGKKSEQQP